MFVVRQPDDTLAQLPAWMCSPEAAAMAVTERPRIALNATQQEVLRKFRRGGAVPAASLSLKPESIGTDELKRMAALE